MRFDSRIILAVMTFVTSPPDMPDLRDYAFDWALVEVEASGLIARRDRVLSHGPSPPV
ncbi:hypothetical protein GA0115259_115093 [Streptomyces sp. MnatMP-M17]|nr:hypothetical protein GA0115259_115093 [Streptomyces sp. MnatMP-M17]